VGETPDHRVLEVARRYGVAITGTARPVAPHDLDRFDLLVCMDHSHRQHLLALGADRAKVRMMLEFASEPGETEVPDPYYGGSEGFESMFRMLDSACDGLLDRVLSHHRGRPDR
jgi:protein-tyrosine phosphatase